MPKLSKESATHIQEFPTGKEWAEELGGYKASLVTVSADSDLTALLKGLPNDHCPCPHWGYVFKGQMWWRFGDHEEVHKAGDAFYVPPGHTSGGVGGSEFLIFSPSDLIATVEAHMAQRAQQLQGASPL